jgi:hypothetical protein
LKILFEELIYTYSYCDMCSITVYGCVIHKPAGTL